MDKPSRMAQLYGYTVCLIGIVVSLVSVSSLLNAALDRANPLQSEYGFTPALTSFEAYAATAERERRTFGPGESAPDTASEATLRQRYDALVTDRLASVRYRTAKTFVSSGVSLAMAIGLFWFHWRWVRRLNGARNGA